jgi:hypothetical protein
MVRKAKGLCNEYFMWLAVKVKVRNPLVLIVSQNTLVQIGLIENIERHMFKKVTVCL